LGQYRKKRTAFSHNVLLVPLGDDFKYKSLDMTRKIFDNYQMLFDYINSDPSLDTSIRFGTLSDYFKALHKQQQSSALSYPSYHGDFFTYNDRDNDYWSGSCSFLLSTVLK
jgi:alpha-mannosidase II